MARRPTRLTRVTEEGLEKNAAVDRKRRQLDEEAPSGKGSRAEQAAAGKEGGVDLPTGGRGGTGVGGTAQGAVDEAVAERAAARVPTDLLGGAATIVRDRTDGAEDGGAGPGGAGPGANPLGGVTSAPANPLADVAASGLRGTSRLGTPEAEGVQAGPSVQDGTATGQFAANLLEFAKGTGDPDGGQANDDGSLVFEGDGGTLTIKDDEFLFQDEETTTVGLIQDGTFAAVQVDNETGDEVSSAAANNAGGEKSETTTTPDPVTGGTTTTTTTTTVPPNTPPPSTPSAAQPREDSNVTPRSGLSPTGRGQEGGDVDPGDGDEIAFGVATGPVPDVQGRLLGGDTAEPEFGGSGGAPSGPGNVDQTGAVDPVDEADFGTGATGPEQDPFDRAEDTLEPSAGEDPPPADEAAVPLFANARAAAEDAGLDGLTPIDPDD